MKAAFVIVFPTVFSKNKIPQLILNIKKILKIKNQKFKSVKRDGDIILVDANDPVFASSAINLLFGIEKIAIARQVENDFEEIVSEITSLSGKLLLKGEKFLVKVDGTSKGFLVKDIEIAATSRIIEQKSDPIPGTDEKHDKLLYSYLTKNNGYICIFSDIGNGGIPYETQREKTVCAIYDEISAISCYETIKQGYDTKIIVCYRQKSELMDLIKYLNQIIPRLIQSTINVEFFNLEKEDKNYLNSILHILLQQTEKRISLALSPLIFSSEFIDDSIKRTFMAEKIPILPLAGIDAQMFDTAKEIRVEKNMKKLEKIIRNSTVIPKISKATVKSKKSITVTIGPNNIHDILDALEENH